MEQFWFGPSQLSRKRRADRVLERIHAMCSKSPSLVRLHATIHTDDTRVPLMQPAPRGATHDKLTAKRSLLASGSSAFATRVAICLSPASNGSNVLEWLSIQYIRQ
jgi:hypothetical protein